MALINISLIFFIYWKLNVITVGPRQSHYHAGDMRLLRDPNAALFLAL